MFCSIYLDGNETSGFVRIGGKTSKAVLLFLVVRYLAHGVSSTWYGSSGSNGSTSVS